MIFGDQGATTAEHALFLEYRYVLLLFTCKLGCCIDAPEVNEINYKLGWFKQYLLAISNQYY